MSEQSFDKEIKDKLESFQFEPTDAEWDSFSQKLEEQICCGPEELDSLIREKMEGYQVHFDPMDWYYMSGVLHGTLDSTLAYNLDKYQLPYDPADWHAMQDKLNEHSFSEIRNKLESYREPFNPLDWRKMRLQMEAAGLIQPKQARFWYKIAAAIALLLLLPLSLERYVPKPYGNIAVTTPSDIEADATPTQEAPTQSEERPDQKTIRPSNNTHADLSHRTISSVQDSNTGSVVSYFSEETHRKEQDSLFGMGEGLIWDSAAAMGIPIATIVPQDFLLERPALFLTAEEIGKSEKNPLLLDFLVGTHLAGAFSMAELHDIPKSGFLGGLKAELQFNENISLSTGLYYAKKQFEHEYTPIDRQDNFAGTRVAAKNGLKAELEILEIPALIIYKLPTDDKKLWMALQGGFVAQVSLSERYLHYNPASANNSDVNRLYYDPYEYKPVNIKRALSTYTSNINTAIIFGYNINETVQARFEPYFQMGLQKIGPEKTRLYSTGLGLSLMYNLSEDKNVSDGKKSGKKAKKILY